MNEYIPFLISWNITKRCNLRCEHCYLDAAELEGRDEVSTEQAMGFVDQIVSLNPRAMLILTGGEPLLRPDCFEIARYATLKGLTVVLGTNGTLLDEDTVGRIKESGIRGVGISLDSAAPSYHDSFRGLEGAWSRTLKGMERLRRENIDFQLQLTVTKTNRNDIPALVDLARRNGARAVNIFFLVCTGRGQNMTDLSPVEYESVLEYLVKAEKDFREKIMVRARCAPHILRIASKKDPESPLLKGETSGCIAARGYLRISPEGFVTPCPYMPVTEESGNLKQRPLGDIWDNDAAFRALRNPVYKGTCSRCEFNDLCGGCRARALATSGDLMGEDPWCDYEPDEDAGQRSVHRDGDHTDTLWTEEARERLEKVPPFLRSMVKRGIERYARAKGLKEITPDVMSELRKRTGR